MTRAWLTIACGSLLACGGGGELRDGGVDARADVPVDDARPDAQPVLRRPDRAVVAWMDPEPNDSWWIEERIAPWPKVHGDRDPGRRAIVREGDEVWAPDDDERMIDACLHPSGEWTAVGVDAAMRPFLARGDATGLIVRRALDDPELPADPRAWIDEPPDALRVGALSESSPSIDADGEDVVVALTSEHHAVVAYRWRYAEGELARGPRTLLSPARVATPFLPIGASYDNFDAVVAPFSVHLVIVEGRTFVAAFADRGRITQHNAVMRTSLELTRSPATLEHPSDAIVFGVDRAGVVAFTTVVGMLDRDDEPFGIAASSERIAIVGRSRREPGRDNTELHAFVAELDHQGEILDVRVWDGMKSAIAQTAAFSADGELWVAGTHDWSQNPTGISLYENGTPFVIRGLGEWTDESSRVPATTGHAELRALAVGDVLAVAGLENGPLTHTGDGDPTRIRSDAFLGWSSLTYGDRD